MNSSRYVYPSLDLLQAPEEPAGLFNDLQDAAFIQAKLLGLGVSASVKKINRGPQATQYALLLEPGANINVLANRKKTLAERLGVQSVHLEIPLRNTSLIGLDVPKEKADPVSLQELLCSIIRDSSAAVTKLPVGKDMQGEPVTCDIHDFPHALIGGNDGAGQIAFLRQIILSLLYRATPEQARLLLIDPTGKELMAFKNIPHLVTNVITDARQGIAALWWLEEEMSRRYQLLQEAGVRNLDGFNYKKPEQQLPVLITVVSELGDLMDADRKSTDTALQRMAVLARTAGIYLLLATQRLDVGSITGVVKANVPSRIAFAVQDKNQSRFIIDSCGAEDLIGAGDMLFFPRSEFRPIHVQACSLTDAEIEAVLQDIALHNAPRAFLATAEDLDKCQEKIRLEKP